MIFHSTFRDSLPLANEEDHDGKPRLYDEIELQTDFGIGLIGVFEDELARDHSSLIFIDFTATLMSQDNNW
jgi:hypothetical protein